MNLVGVLYFFQALWAFPDFTSMTKSSSSGHHLFNISQFYVPSLPDGPPLPSSWAGRLPVPGAPKGNEIFFWLFDTEDPMYDDNLIIWFNGGPGCSSLVGLTTGNGPISFAGNSTQIVRNHYSWTKLGHVLYVDQPVGTGFSTASNPYPVRTNERVTTDFVQWLQAFMSYFPHLKSKQLHLMGESYAGIYIPYFAAALLEGNYSLPLNLQSMSLGDGSWGNAAAMSSVAIGSYINSQSSRLKVTADVLSAFSSADQMCDFTNVLEQARTYPPKGKIHIPGNPENLNYRRRQRRDVASVLDDSCDIQPSTPAAVTKSILNSTCYGPCATYSTAMDYVSTISAAGSGPACYDVYDISHNCSTIDPLPLLATYYSRADVQAALHVRNNGPYSACNSTILGTLLTAPSPVPPEYSILPSLVTTHNISLHLYNGELDMLINHIGTELSIQNMTWRGGQGFSRKPHRLFYADDAAPPPQRTAALSSSTDAAEPVGTWASERGVSYHLFKGAGHSVFATKQREMFAFVRDVVVGAKAQ
ncbi:Peptidase S10 serine carboxypeptidase [Penicillium hispanicum]|uniref:Peptidase S10 serine carboxypeptidase n=1 Tax=Penicillium hispanicum TaxID=1080232 RepID=UPI00253FECF9|nr:Peptidase S10 serine carboxypeptidase [Penicillium hispanicum]KAJ5569889.1 Peptidase S10 serine carboxypeptidase [Penicillium hispanicum]